MPNRISVEDALQQVRSACVPRLGTRVPVEEAVGRVTTSDIVSRGDSPPYSKSLMDGYAVFHGEHQRRRKVVETVAAGQLPHHAITPGHAARIMTGAPVPEGANAVVPIEEVSQLDSEYVEMPAREILAGEHVLGRGACIARDRVVVEAHTKITPFHVALIGEAGHATVDVIRPPRVAILPTGNELIPIEHEPNPAQIRNTNGPMLTAAIAQAGGRPHQLGIAADQIGLLQSSVEKGLQHDILLITGGVSTGDFDLIPEVLGKLKVKNIFHGVALKPGKPLWFGIYDRRNEADAELCESTLVFGLPGNPVSAMVCCELFVKPAMSRLAGGEFNHPKRRAYLTETLKAVGERTTLLPARVEPAAETSDATRLPNVRILPWLGSADLSPFAQANGLAILPAGNSDFAAGTIIEVLSLSSPF